MDRVDISLLSYEDWVRFVFDAPIRKIDDKSWRNDLSDTTGNPSQLLEYFKTACADFTFLVSYYSPAQIDQGFWLLLGCQIDIPRLLNDTAIPIDIRKTCIAAMSLPYTKVLASRSDLCAATNCFYMWFDMVAKGFWHAVSYRTDPIADISALIAQDREIHDAILNTLRQILQLNSDACKLAALHGLGHLHHPLGEALVQEFLDTTAKDWSVENRQWIETCRDGTVM